MHYLQFMLGSLRLCVWRLQTTPVWTVVVGLRTGMVLELGQVARGVKFLMLGYKQRERSAMTSFVVVVVVV